MQFLNWLKKRHHEVSKWGPTKITFVLVLSIIAGGLAYAQSYVVTGINGKAYRAPQRIAIDNYVPVQVDEFGECRVVQNITTKDLFVPTKYDYEWSNFRQNVAGDVATLDECSACPTGYQDDFAGGCVGRYVWVGLGAEQITNTPGPQRDHCGIRFTDNTFISNSGSAPETNGVSGTGWYSGPPSWYYLGDMAGRQPSSYTYCASDPNVWEEWKYTGYAGSSEPGFCGDGILHQGFEDCDGTANCIAGGLPNECTCANPYIASGGLCVSPPSCGDGTYTYGEDCDGGALCTGSCTCPSGYGPDGSGGCYYLCGNGMVETSFGEQCEPGWDGNYPAGIGGPCDSLSCQCVNGLDFFGNCNF